MDPIYTTSGHQNSEQKEALSIRYIKKINTIAVTGYSTGLEVFPAYTNLIQQLDDHFLQYNTLKCYFHYAVINASTTKMLFKLFRKLAKEQEKGSQIVIYWVIEENDQELIDVGLDFKNLYDLNFHITVK